MLKLHRDYSAHYIRVLIHRPLIPHCEKYPSVMLSSCCFAVKGEMCYEETSGENWVSLMKNYIARAFIKTEKHRIQESNNELLL